MAHGFQHAIQLLQKPHRSSPAYPQHLLDIRIRYPMVLQHMLKHRSHTLFCTHGANANIAWEAIIWLFLFLMSLIVYQSNPSHPCSINGKFMAN